eukprot:1406591-Rhodomonas_salina.1
MLMCLFHALRPRCRVKKDGQLHSRSLERLNFPFHRGGDCRIVAPQYPLPSWRCFFEYFVEEREPIHEQGERRTACFLKFSAPHAQVDELRGSFGIIVAEA